MAPSLAAIYRALREHFGPLHGPAAPRPWWPIFGPDPAFEVLVGAVLVQQTRWETVEAAVLRLLDAGLLAPGPMAAADPERLAGLVRPAAFHGQKARGLIAVCAHIEARYGGDLGALLARPSADLRAELLGLPRIGRETCDVIMLYAGGHSVFVVDEYTRRLLERVGPRNGDPETRRPGDERTFWRRGSYEQLRLAIEAELVCQAPHQIAEHPHPLVSPSPGLAGSQPLGLPGSLAPLYADYHAQINEACVRYCLSRPRCDGPPARRVYSRQPGRESYHGRDEGCPLRPVCSHYQGRAL